MTARSSRTYPVVIPANSAAILNVTGEFIYVLECDLTSFLVAIDGGPSDETKFRTYKRLPAGDSYSKLEIENPNGAALTLKIVAGFGSYSDDEVTIGGSVTLTVPATQTPGTDLAISAGTTQSIAANANRKECFMQANGELRLSGVTSKGAKWNGLLIYVTSKGAIDFFNDTAGTVTVTFTELAT